MSEEAVGSELVYLIRVFLAICVLPFFARETGLSALWRVINRMRPFLLKERDMRWFGKVEVAGDLGKKGSKSRVFLRL